MFEIDDEDNTDLTDVITGNNGLIYTGKIMAFYQNRAASLIPLNFSSPENRAKIGQSRLRRQVEWPDL